MQISQDAGLGVNQADGTCNRAAQPGFPNPPTHAGAIRDISTPQWAAPAARISSSSWPKALPRARSIKAREWTSCIEW